MNHLFQKRACNKQITKKEAKDNLYCDNISNRIGRIGMDVKQTNEKLKRKYGKSNHINLNTNKLINRVIENTFAIENNIRKNITQKINIVPIKNKTVNVGYATKKDIRQIIAQIKIKKKKKQTF